MATLSEVCIALRDQLRTVLTTVHYPMPGSISGNQITAVVFSAAGDLTYRGGSEQEWMETIRVQIYAGTQDTPTTIGALDGLIEPIADLFSADNVISHTLGGIVDFCKLSSYELSQTLEVAGHSFYGGTLSFSVKRRRFSGD